MAQPPHITERGGGQTMYTYINMFCSCKAEQPRKRSKKRLKHTGNLFRKSLHLKGVC